MASAYRPLCRAAGALAVVAAVGLAGCSADDSGVDDPDPVTVTTRSNGATAPPASTTDDDASDRDIVVSEAVLVMDHPLSMVSRHGDDALYIIERDGRVTSLRDGVVGTAVLDFGKELSDFTEDGLLGLVYSADGAIAYVNRTETNLDDGTGVTAIIEYAVESDGTFDLSSARIIYSFDQPYHQHNGGEIMLGPDGMLWIPTGDGGGQGDPDRVALDLSTPLGKLLRIDPTPSDGQSFTVPPDNPFVDVEGALPEIWSTGLRSPWRASFDRVTGDLWIGDVGEADWEELNVVWADEGLGRGSSYGWSAYEGTHRFNEDQQVGGATGEHVLPIFEYGRETGGCSISAGERYRGDALPELWGWFVYADLCTGDVIALEITDERAVASQRLLGNVVEPVAVRADGDGELWVLSYRGGVHRVEAA